MAYTYLAASGESAAGAPRNDVLCTLTPGYHGEDPHDIPRATDTVGGDTGGKVVRIKCCLLSSSVLQ